MSQVIDIIGTEDFYDGFEDSDPVTRRNDLTDWCSNVWEAEIRGSGQYDATFYSMSRSAVEIPSSALSQCYAGNDCPTLSARLTDSRVWLSDNYQYWDLASSVMVLDYYPGDDQRLGVAYGDRAGTNYKVGIINMHFEDTNYYDDIRHDSLIRSDGVTMHELAHNYSADHSDSEIHASGDVTLVHSGASYYCYDSGASPSRTIGRYGGCTKAAIRNYISGM